MINIKYYTVHHCHDDTSNCNGYADSCTKYKEYIKLAKKQGMKAIAFSNHGGIYDWIKKKQDCDKAGIKYIHGIELYLCRRLEDDDRGSHIGLYAKNFNGVLELNNLISIASSKGVMEDNSDRHMYYNPRISLEELMNTSDNIIVTTACLASPLNRWNINNDEEFRFALDKLINWLHKNRHRCFLEVQYHNYKSQIEYNKYLFKISKEKNIPLIAGTDTHSSSQYKAECRKIYQIYKDNFYGEEDEFDLTWKTYDELVEAFKIQNALDEKIYLEAIENTNILANMVEEFELDKSFKYPTLYGDNVREQWKELICTEFNKKRKSGALNLSSKIILTYENYLKSGLPIDENPISEDVYKTALKTPDSESIKKYYLKIAEEFKVMCKLGMESFMMFMSELVNWCEENDIPRGTGRGSVCGSTIAYITNITDVDPLLWNTVFSRFCNEDRVSLGDIDIDFASEDREKVYKYIIDRFTPQKTAYIAAFSTLQDRGCIDVLAGGLGYKDLDKVKEIKNKFEELYLSYGKIIQEEVNIEDLIEDKILDSSTITFDNHNIYISRINQQNIKNKADKLKHEYDNLIKENQDLFYYLDGLKGTIVAKGVHPSGIIGSPVTLADNIGLFYRDGDLNTPVSTCAMKSVDSLNYVKFDILGLKTVGIIKDACKYAGIPYPKSYDVNWNDRNIWNNMITSQQGVFQFEGDYAFSLLKDFKPTTINHMSMVNAALRPSGKSYRDRLIAGEFNNNPSKEIDELLKDNRGFLIFQEDTIKFLTDICDFSGSSADTTRRCVDENTLIMMGNGDYKKIKDIKVGDIVQSYNQNNISEPQSVVNVFNNGFKQTYSVETQHGYIINATDNHKMLTQRGWVQIKELTTNDFIMTPKSINPQTDNLKPSNRLSETDMFLIGMLMGDGTIGKDSNLHFTNSELILINKFKDCVNKRLRNKNLCKFYTNTQNGVDVDFIYSIYIKSDNYKKSVINLLDKYNLRQKADNKHLPDEIMLYPKGSKLSNLLAGLFNTDGGYNFSQSMIEYYTTSEMLALQIKSLLLKHNIYSYIDKQFISDYNYYSYRLYIRQVNSLMNFQNKILPYIIGKKYNEFSTIINNAKNNLSKFNYLLPNECKKEILSMSKKTNTSLRSVGYKIGDRYNTSDLEVHKNEFGISDIKAKNIIQHLYCPYTYRLLFAEYLPVRVKSIKFLGENNVFDIEVKNNHNYIANNLIVHNCIGKKDMDGLKEQLPKILKGYCNHSPKERNIAEEEAKQFVQIISDSSEYQFGYNHSTAYSMNGYECVALRTYYPIEFIAAYLNRAENKEDTNNGIELAKQYNIKIKPIQFGKSLSDYTIDKDNNTIYKGIRSIKYCNAIIANELLDLANNNTYKSFIELLDDIHSKTSVDARQLKILTILNFFSVFGKNKYLLNIIGIYDDFRHCRQINKSKLDKLNLSEDVIGRYSNKETKALYKEIDNMGLINELCKDIENKPLSIKEQIKYEINYLEYIIYINPKAPKDMYYVVETKFYKDKSKPYLTLYNLRIGETLKTKITQGKRFIENPFKDGNVINIKEFKEKNKMKMINGKWTKTNEIEQIVALWEVY